MISLVLVVLVSAINPGGKALVAETNGWPEKTHGLSAPTDSRDLIVFIAKWKSNLYRLVGSRPVPYGTAHFYNPISIVSDPVQQCFYVLDRPKLVSETTKIASSTFGVDLIFEIIKSTPNVEEAKKPTRYLNDLMKKMLTTGHVEYTIPEKPKSRLQKYRLKERTAKEAGK